MATPIHHHLETQAPSLEAPETPAIDARIQQAVREEITAFGLKRATMISIARRAGVSRATLHRRAEGVQQLVLNTLVLQFGQLITSAHERARAQTFSGVLEELEATVEFSILGLWADDLFGALIDHDSKLLTPYLVQRVGRTQKLLVSILAAWIRAAQGSGTVRSGAPEALALGLIQALAPFAVGRKVFQSVEPEVDWPAEAGRLARQYLAPNDFAPSSNTKAASEPHDGDVRK